MDTTILVVDDDNAIRELVREFLSELADPPTVTEAGTVEEAMTRFEADSPDLMLLDMRLPDGDGLDVLARIRATGSTVPIVVITADSSSSRTIRAVQGGAWDYLVKPLEPETVRLVVERALAHRTLTETIRFLQETVAERDVPEKIVGSSGPMQAVYKLVGRVASSDVPVLITGETGTGKELVAETIHENSRRRRGPLVRVNCAALPETLLESELFGHEQGAFTGAIDRRKGRFELADKGSIFLDEIGEMEPSTQKKLLRVLQSGRFERVGGQATIEVDARVIAATNIDLEAAVASGRFREDLYYRLDVIRIDMPPLRSRRDDIPALVAHFLDKYRPGSGPAKKISEEAMTRLLEHDWPGNVRQLENSIQRAVVLSRGEVISEDDLDLEGAPPIRTDLVLDPAALVQEGLSLEAVIARVERSLAAEALRSAKGDALEAAKLLGITPQRFERARHAAPDRSGEDDR